MPCFDPSTSACETGLGDSALCKRMRSLAGDFLGRAIAYDKALESGPVELLAALSRNVYEGHGDPTRLARYVEAADRALADMPRDLAKLGPLPFPRPSAKA